MSDKIGEIKIDNPQTNLVRRVRAKLREKYGGMPEAEMPAAKDLPQALGLADGTPFPTGFLKRIDEFDKKSGDDYTFVLVVQVNGTELPVTFSIGGPALASVQQDDALKMIMREIITRATRAVMDHVKQAIAQEIFDLAETKQWRHVDRAGIFPL